MKTKKHNPANKEENILMPEVKDIPGQENIRPPRFNEMADTTISSADEEGEGILDDLNKEQDQEDAFENLSESTNVTEIEKQLLDQSDRPVTEETEDIKKMALDETDDEDELNEKSNPLDMGEDLDVPGADLDDDDEDIGEEDEENNSYSQGQR